MPNPEQVSEARRELADELEFATSHYPDNQLVTIGFTAKNWRIILAALRADPARAAEEEIALTQPQAALLAKALEPLARADRAIGEEPGPFRFETEGGFRDLSRDDIRQAASVHRVLAVIGALAQEKGGGDG